MNISAKTEYACIAVLELAARHGGEPVRIGAIAERHGIPKRFLVQILLQLKGAGLVASTRGASGGYQLLKPPEEISLAEVMQVIEGPAEEAGKSSAAGATSVTRALWNTWNAASQQQWELLSGTTFADLLENIDEQSENMYYI